jgi:hypothetical protein
VRKIEVYLGKGAGRGEHGLGYHVVDKMVESIERQGHCLVVNNLCTSLNLFHHFMTKGVLAVEIVIRSSKNLPTRLYCEMNLDIWRLMLI